MTYKAEDRVSRFESWVRRKGFKCEMIRGCEAQGDQNKTYMERFFLVKKAVLFHVFHKSDMDRAPHDHPFVFMTIILTGGYFEHQFNKDGTEKPIRWFPPGSVLFRGSKCRHYVELPCYGNSNIKIYQKATTLVIRSWYIKPWGFYVAGNFIPWKDFFKINGCAGQK